MNLLKTPAVLLSLALNQIDEGDRARKDYGDVSELTESIRREGLIQPIAVKAPDPIRGGRYLLLAGGRRLRAVSQLGLPEISCRVYPHDISILEERSIELAENIKRKDLEYAEEVALCKEIHDLQVQIYGEKLSTSTDAPGWSQADTAALLGRSPASVTLDIRLAKAIEIMPQLASLKNKSEAMKLLSMAQEEEVKKELARRLTSAKAETDEQKLKARLCNCYVVGDFFLRARDIPDGTVDLIEIDPPYAIDLSRVKEVATEASREKLGLYNEVPANQYLPFLSATLKEAWRLLKDGGWLILWFGPEPWFEPVYTLVTSVGFSCKRMPAIWVKPSPMAQTMQPNLYLGSGYEMFFYARKHTSVIAQPGRTNTFLYKQIIPADKVHPTERPIELMEEILKTFALPGSFIVVPFSGSGNTLLAAANLDMDAIGFDLTEEYKNPYVIKVHSQTYGHYFTTKRQEEV